MNQQEYINHLAQHKLHVRFQRLNLIFDDAESPTGLSEESIELTPDPERILDISISNY